ncbi:hypothetical protein SAMN02983003_0706 [Devosia enhydra]|uniref:Uncharacterized protein n=1 Tax=Devosia enhydra TaxID=665118 RepID=A0A1K2HU13_9HYPH|nr:hypothetical protein [Devosia enhydra]SFZ81812.1 hypothetical protein SAMN02983003_0706 [Devosia enhydra]
MTLSIRRRMRQQTKDAAQASTLPCPVFRQLNRLCRFLGASCLRAGVHWSRPQPLGTPVASALAEDPATRVARLAEELSVALDSYVSGSFRAIIEPDSKSTCPVLFQNRRRLDARDRLNRAMGASRDALAEIYGCDPADHSFIGERKGAVVIAAMPPTERVVWDFEAVS